MKVRFFLAKKQGQAYNGGVKARFFSVFFALCACSLFPADVTADFLFGAAYTRTGVSGRTENAEDFGAVFRGMGFLVGADFFFDGFPIGAYFRISPVDTWSVEKDAPGIPSGRLPRTQRGDCGVFIDAGAVYELRFGDFSLNAAPALSLAFLTSEYFHALSGRNSTDTLLAFGLTGDVYLKWRHKAFVLAAGCAASFYPLASMSSDDTEAEYAADIRHTMAWNVRPYLAVGITTAGLW